MSAGFIHNLLTQVDSISKTFVFDGYHRLVESYANAIYGLVILAVIVFGYLITMGFIELSLKEIGKRLLLIGFVLTLAMHWDIFSNNVYALFNKAPNEIALNIVHAIPSVNKGENFNDEIEGIFDDGMNYSLAVTERGGKLNLWPYIWGLLMGIVTLVIIVIALVELIAAKFGLAIYIVLAPLIIPMMLFEATKSAVFDGWFKHLVTFAFVPIFVTSAMAMMVLLMASFNHTLQNAITADKVTFSEVAFYLLGALISGGLLLKASHMAVSLAGGFSSGMSQHVTKAANFVNQKIKDSSFKFAKQNSATPTPQSSPSLKDIPSNE